MKVQERKYLWFAACFLCIVMATFIIGQTAYSDDSSTVIISESPDPAAHKTVVRPSRKNIETKYNVETGPVKIIGPQKQNQRPAKAPETHGESVSSSDDRIRIEIGPVKKISPEAMEKVKTGDDIRSRDQRPVPEGREISGDIKVEPISQPDDNVELERRKENGKRTHRGESETGGIEKKVSTPMPIEQTEKADKNFEIQTVPIKAMENENSQTSQPPLVERIKVTRVRAWKLDESGNKTNEKIVDDTSVIEGINQPPSE